MADLNEPGTGAAHLAREPWTVRVAMWSARHRWPVAALWFVVTIGLFVASLAAGGTRAQEAVSNDQRARFEAGEAYVIFGDAGPSEEEEEPSQQYLLVVATNDGRSVADPAIATSIDDLVARLTEASSTVNGAEVPTFTDLIHPLKVPPQAGLVSPDRTAARIVARVLGDGPALAERLDPTPGLVVDLRADHPDLTILALNNTLANAEIGELVNSDLDGSLRLTIPLTFAILLIAFGAVVAAVVPLVLAVTALLAAFGTLGLYSQLVSPVSPYASQLIVLIGLAVAVDYSLFMVTRFRSERRNGRSKDSSIEVASSTAGRAVFFSGLAVMISIAGLFLLDDPLFRSMAIGTIAVVFIAVVGSLTFLPATLAILGDRVNRGRIPIIGRDRPEASGFWSTAVRFAMRRPLIVAVTVAVALVAAASPVGRLHIGQTDFTSFPDTLEAVQAVNLINDKWPDGSTLQLQVVVTRADEPATQAAIERMTAELLALDGLGEPTSSRLSGDGTVAMVSVVMSGGENDLANRAIVDDVRGRVVPEVFGTLDGVRALVTGDAAYTKDVTDFYAEGLPLVIGFVLSLSFVLLLVAFHSIVIPIKAILLNILSTGTAYGLLVLVFQEGWLHEQIGFKPGVIESFVPIFIFTILFGLSMDYHVFILTRIKEARDRGLDSNAAVERGITITSGTITSAAAIMVVVFSVFVTLELVVIKQLGFGLAVAVLVDATIIRSFLLPATMRLLGDWNWWMPPFLRWIPRVTIEGESEEPEAVSVGA